MVIIANRNGVYTAFDDEEETKENKAATNVIKQVRPVASNIVEPNLSILKQRKSHENDLQTVDYRKIIRESGLDGTNIMASNFTVDTNDLPQEPKLKLERKATVVKVDLVNGKLQYTARMRKTNNDGTLADGYEDAPANWSLNDILTMGYSYGTNGHIIIEDAVFIYDDQNKDQIETLLRPAVKNIISPQTRQNTLQHEMEHINNRQKMKDIMGDKHPHVGVKDYYRLCYYDEIAANLAPLVEEIQKINSGQLRREDTSYINSWFYDKYKGQDLPDISSIEGQKQLLADVIENWDTNDAKLYAKYQKRNSPDKNPDAQFSRDVMTYIMENPWSTDTSQQNDFAPALVAILKVKGIDFAKVLDKNYDPITRHQDLNYTVTDKQNETHRFNWLDVSEKMAAKRLEVLAQMGLSEEVIRQIKQGSLQCPFNATEVPFEIGETPKQINDDQIETYRRFFKEVAQRDHLKYDEDEQAPIYTLKLIKYSNPEEPDESKRTVDNTTNITIDGNRSVVMNATKADGTPEIPDQQRFNDLAELAYQTADNKIKFGNISSPEYAARLYLACISHQPPVQMNGAPDFNNTQFRQAIKPETLSKIEALLPDDKKTWTQESQNSKSETNTASERIKIARDKMKDYQKSVNAYNKAHKSEYEEAMSSKDKIVKEKFINNRRQAFIASQKQKS